ncbi:MAG: ABC transporter permease subunit [Planctomycetes bacterium]|nr:ABC transporter permease subunit [Planctomycetota bacterium]
MIPSVAIRRTWGPTSTFLLALGLATFLALWQLDFLGGSFSAPGGLSEFRRFFAAALRPTMTSANTGTSILPDLREALGTTVFVAFAAMGLALVVGFVFGCLASESLWERDPVVMETAVGRVAQRALLPTWLVAIRAVMAFLRSIHEIFWALLFTALFGLSLVCGILALAIPYAATLGRIYAEIIDETPRDAARAIRGAGGGRAATFLVGLLPRAAGSILSYSFYRFDCALRSSSILGFVGFTTIGLNIRTAANYDHYQEVWTYLYALFALLVATEVLSGALRRRIAAWR